MHHIHNKLYLYNKYLFLFQNLIRKKKLPTSILISGNEGIGKKSFIIHFLSNVINNFNTNKNNSISSINILEDHNFCKKIFSDNNLNIKYVNKIDNNSTVTIDQIRDIITFCKHTSLNGKSKFVIIDNIEYFNLYASNALLKILETPPNNCYFFLICHNSNLLIKTIKSRCVQFSIKFSSSERIFILNNLLDDLSLSNFNNFKIFSNFNMPGDIINKIIFLNHNLISQKNINDIIIFCINDYKKNKNVISFKNAIDFSQNLFYQKNYLNFSKFNKIYNNFSLVLSNYLKYNSDITKISNLLKQIS